MLNIKLVFNYIDVANLAFHGIKNVSFRKKFETFYKMKRYFNKSSDFYRLER